MSRARAWARFAKSRTGVAGAAIVLGMAVFAAIGPLLARHDPLESDFDHGMSTGGTPVGPSGAFFLGADRLFRDVFARLASGGRLSLAIAVASTVVSMVLGTVVGVIAGWHEGRRSRMPWPALAGACGTLVALGLGHPAVAVGALAAGAGASIARPTRGPAVDVDALLMRLVDVLLAFPFLLLVMALAAALDRTTALTTVLTLGATGWLGVARVIRAKTMQVRSLDYVAAARALGRSTFGVVLSHVLPNVAGTLVVLATTQVAQMIVADSVLSYLGVGVAPPTPTWGRMLHEGQDAYATAPWLVVAPGTAIVLAVFGFNMLGEGLRDALDPNAG